MVGTSAVSDVTISATVEQIAGSDDETGTGLFQALASGSRRIDLHLSSGEYSEVRNLSAPPAGKWSGPDGVLHPVAFHNLLSEPVWFFPAIGIAPLFGGSASSYTVTYIGHESYDSQSVEHIRVSQVSPLATPTGGVTHEHLTAVEFYLDSSTLFPAAMKFSIHPDNNALLDIPVEIRFADYRSTSGLQAPYHVQEFVNGGLVLDLQAQSITINTGISSNQFSIQ